jgi:hypothetical protein
MKTKKTEDKNSHKLSYEDWLKMCVEQDKSNELVSEVTKRAAYQGYLIVDAFSEKLEKTIEELTILKSRLDEKE